MSLLILNDLHLGVKRTGGTTPATQNALRNHLHISFYQLIFKYKKHDLLILGDLFDGFQVDPHDLVQTFTTLADWLQESGKNLYLVSGNHDYQPKAGKLSSFEMLCVFLSRQFGDRITVIDHNTGITMVRDGVYVIPHMPNQDLFDAEIKKANDAPNKGWLLFHANYDNTFAEQSDHSLNVSREQAQYLTKKYKLMFAHEHQARTDMGGDVIVIGNQFPSSVSDCMAKGAAQRDGLKRCVIIEDDLGYSEITTWDAISSYKAVDWRNIEAEGYQFVRVEGTADVSEAADCVNAIAAFRSKSNAFVVTNAVRIEGAPDMGDLSELSFESIKSFDVLSALLETLSDEEATVVKELVNAQTT